MPTRPARPAHVLALSEGPIPSAVLGVHTLFETLSARTDLCLFRSGSSITAAPEDLAWADTIVLVRGAAPSERRLLAEAHRLGRRVATYLDDDLEEVPAEARSGYFFTSPNVRANIAAIVRESDDVLVCSDRLGAELARRHGSSPVRVFQPRPARLPGEAVPRPSPTPVRIGFLGSVDHADFLDRLLADVLREIQREFADAVRFVFCGADPAIARALGAERHPFEADFTTWRRRALGLELGIGLAPLPAGSFFERKYWNKYLEYGSLGVPGVYSDTPPNADIVRDGATGILCANEPGAWHEALRRLIGDPGLRRRLGHAAYLDVEARFAAGALVPHWRTALQPLLAHRAPACTAGDVRLRTGSVWHALDRLAIYGPLRFTERVLGRITGRLRDG